MAESITEGDVDRFETRVPPELENQSQIQDFLDENTTLSGDGPEEFAKRIGQRRAEEAGDRHGGIDPTPPETATAVYDPSVGQWRDQDTGQFVSDPNE